MVDVTDGAFVTTDTGASVVVAVGVAMGVEVIVIGIGTNTGGVTVVADGGGAMIGIISFNDDGGRMACPEHSSSIE
jgi:hypothetical protein